MKLFCATDVCIGVVIINLFF